MRLHDFILKEREQILVEWEAFALTCKPASENLDSKELRDHADQMLSMIAADLQTSQTELEQAEKAKGKTPPSAESDATAAEDHGSERAASGFTVEQTVAEFRALRASVLRLWTEETGTLEPSEIGDLTRFNEAIDQLLAESVYEYFGVVENTKEMFIGILGHDLRTPLGGIQTAARFMVDDGALGEPYLGLTVRIDGLAENALQLVGDLLDFTRGRLGGGIPIDRDEVDLSTVVHDAVEEIQARHPQRHIQMDGGQGEGPVGQWDAARIQQALTNLLSNAIEHGDQGTSVRIEFGENTETVSICIHNRGDPIPAHRLERIFDPWKPIENRRSGSNLGPTGNLGLGLYIAERIVDAHGGQIDVESSEADGTTFTVRLPRSA